MIAIFVINYFMRTSIVDTIGQRSPINIFGAPRWDFRKISELIKIECTCLSKNPKINEK